MSARLRLAASGAALLGATVALAAPSAAAALVRVHPARLPLSLGLPAGWQVVGLAPGTRFDAEAGDGSAHLAVTAAAFPGSFAEFVATETALSRRFYLSQDAHASIAVHPQSLSSGPALEIEVSLEQGGGPLSITLFSLLHAGVTYHFTYYTSQSLAASERPQFAASARSISFSGAAALAPAPVTKTTPAKTTPAKTTPAPATTTTPAKPAAPKATPKPKPLAKPAVKATPKASTSAGVSTGLVRVHPARLPLSLGLPAGWQVVGLAPGTRFDAEAGDGSAHLAVTAAAFPGSFAEFVATETALSRRFYLSQDAHASIAVHPQSLSSGPALEIEVSLEQGGGPLSITLFSLLHAGVTYHFTYYTSQSLAASERPQFAASARSISFSG